MLCCKCLLVMVYNVRYGFMEFKVILFWGLNVNFRNVEKTLIVVSIKNVSVENVYRYYKWRYYLSI